GHGEHPSWTRTYPHPGVEPPIYQWARPAKCHETNRQENEPDYPAIHSAQSFSAPSPGEQQDIRRSREYHPYRQVLYVHWAWGDLEMSQQPTRSARYLRMP